MPASFYDPTNEEGATSRVKACNAALDDLIAYMKQEGVRVAAFDATNGTRDRREHLMQSLKASGMGAKIIFLESICDNEQVSLKQSGCTGAFSLFKTHSHKRFFFNNVAARRKHSQSETKYARLS